MLNDVIVGRYHAATLVLTEEERPTVRNFLEACPNAGPDAFRTYAELKATHCIELEWLSLETVTMLRTCRAEALKHVAENLGDFKENVREPDTDIDSEFVSAALVLAGRQIPAF